MKRTVTVTVGLVLALFGCGGGGGSPSAPTPPTTTLPPARDGVLVLDGPIGGTFTLSSSPSRLSGGRLFGCGDAVAEIPYRETAGGNARGGDYEMLLLEWNNDFARRATGSASNLTFGPNERGTITLTERFVCIEYKDNTPPRAQVVLLVGGTVNGTVSRLEGTGPLTVR